MDFAVWNAAGFSFVRCGIRFEKEPGSSDFTTDNCSNEVYENDELSQQIPMLIMWLNECGVVGFDL